MGISASLMMRTRWAGRRLRADARGSVALEYAIVGPVFLALILGILHVSLIYLAQEGLETSAESSARLVMTGAAQTAALGSGASAYTGMTASDFKTAICNGLTAKDVSGNSVTYAAMLPPMLVCSRLAVNVEVVPAGCTTPTIAAPTYTYSGTTVTSTGTGFGTINCAGTTNSNAGLAGTQNKLVILQLAYLWPTIAGQSGINFSNQPGGNRLLVATYVFTVENYTCATGSGSC